jgi:bifunctional non-homologous end joining protein LigD
MRGGGPGPTLVAVSSPPRLLPMLAGGSGIPPDPGAHQFEPKLDGQRIIVTVEPAGVVLTNRRGGEITGSYPELAGLAGALASHAVVLDGEVVTFNEKGQTSFQRLQRRMHVMQPTAELLVEVPAVFVAFDILWLDDEWLIGCPQHERTRILGTLGLTGPAWQTAPILEATPTELVEACRQLGLEGFMAKRLDAPYQPGRRSPAWSKIKCGRRREFVVGGWSSGQGSRQTSIGSVALGCYDLTPEEAERQGRPQSLFYVGQAGSGLNEDMIRQLTRLFAQIKVPEPPFVNPPKLALHPVQPMLVVEIAYTEVTEAGTLRQPSVKGLRTDVIAGEVTWDDEIAERFTRSEDAK